MFVRWKIRQLTGPPAAPFSWFGQVDVEIETSSGGKMRVCATERDVQRGTKDGRRYRMVRYHTGQRSRKVTGDVERHSHHAFLVESVRVNGKPRQQTVAYLGSYQDGEPERASARVAFWKRMDARLASLSVSDEVKLRAADAIARRMPRPGATGGSVGQRC